MDLIGKTPARIFLFNVYTRVTLPLLIRAADTVFVSSFDYAQNSPILSRYFKIYKHKFVELPNSVDTSVYAPLNDETPSGFLSTGAYAGRRPEFKEFFSRKISGPEEQVHGGVVSRYSMKDDRHVILFVGGLDSAHYFKGVNVLLEAAKNVVTRFPKTAFVFVGDGDMRAGYEKHAQQLGIAESVYFTCSVSREDLPRWYNRATCVVLPSVDSTEAFGVVLIEAGACGKPVIATNLPGVRSVVSDGGTGYLVEPKSIEALSEKICAILENPDHARQMGQAGLQRVQERYAYTVVAKKFIDTIQRK
ncbi:MAG: glycosyltransferase family 4 protein, partial [Candidatus Uhrbacteria bacterium]|nr:glycosyltransferase family 4 protein [Candidatus Uhrbacteria bacterium]